MHHIQCIHSSVASSPPAILRPSAELLFYILCCSNARGGLLCSGYQLSTVLPLDLSRFLKRIVWIMKAYFGDKSLLIFQAFSCFLEDFALSFLLFSLILKPYNWVLNQTLFVILVDCSLRKWDHNLRLMLPLLRFKFTVCSAFAKA